MIERSSNFTKIIKAAAKDAVGKKVSKGFDILESKMSYFDYSVADGKVAFTALQAKPQANVDPYKDARRTTTKFAAFIQKTFELPEDAARKFHEVCVARILEETDESNIIKLLSGEDVRWAYNSKNYVPGTTNGNNLRSCMSGAESQGRLDLYCFNSHIQLATNLIKEKVAARALLFTAYSSIGDAIRKENATKVLARIYASSASARTRMIEWRDKNAAFYLEGSSTFKTKKSKAGETPRYWYVPLEHYNLNGWPYLDNLRGLFKDGKDVYLATNTNFGFPVSPKAEPFPHPFKPNLAYVSAKNIWMDKKKLVLSNGQWIIAKDLEECKNCKQKYEKSHVVPYYKGGKICLGKCKAAPIQPTKVGAKITYALPADIRKYRCGPCGYGILLTGDDEDKKQQQMCHRCIKLYVYCKCSQLIPLQSKYKIQDSDENLCSWCISKRNLRQCSKCAEWAKDVKLTKRTGKYMCSKCYPVESGEKTIENGSINKGQYTITLNL